MQLSLPILIGAALSDSINPAAFTALILLLSSTSSPKSNHTPILKQGYLFSLGYFFSSFTLGLIFLSLSYNFTFIIPYFYQIIGLIVTVLGLFELYRIYRPRHSCFQHMFLNFKQRSLRYASSPLKLPTSLFILGSTIGLSEFPLSRGIYIATLSIINTTMPAYNTYTMLAVYNIIVIVPLLIITLTIHKGLSIKKFQLWQSQYHSQLQLGTALLLTIFGVWLISLS